MNKKEGKARSDLQREELRTKGHMLMGLRAKYKDVDDLYQKWANIYGQKPFEEIDFEGKTPHNFQKASERYLENMASNKLTEQYGPLPDETESQAAITSNSSAAAAASKSNTRKPTPTSTLDMATEQTINNLLGPVAASLKEVSNKSSSVQPSQESSNRKKAAESSSGAPMPSVTSGTPTLPITSGTPTLPITSGTPTPPVTSGTPRPQRPVTSGMPTPSVPSGTPMPPVTSGTPTPSVASGTPRPQRSATTSATHFESDAETTPVQNATALTNEDLGIFGEDTSDEEEVQEYKRTKVTQVSKAVFQRHRESPPLTSNETVPPNHVPNTSQPHFMGQPPHGFGYYAHSPAYGQFFANQYPQPYSFQTTPPPTIDSKDDANVRKIQSYGHTSRAFKKLLSTFSQDQYVALSWVVEVAKAELRSSSGLTKPTFVSLCDCLEVQLSDVKGDLLDALAGFVQWLHLQSGATDLPSHVIVSRLLAHFKAQIVERDSKREKKRKHAH